MGKKLAGDASDDELFELEKLMRVHPELLYAAQHIEDLWKMRDKNKTEESEEAFIAHFRKIRNIWPVSIEDNHTDQVNRSAGNKFSFKTKYVPLIVLSIAAIFSTILWLNKKEAQTKSITNFSEVSTKPGSRSKLVLPDGSMVWLNAGSKITYGSNFGTLNRNIQLTGEAFFDVKKSNIPFIIHTSAVQIKVLGTAFDVKAYPTEHTIETSLIRGKVEVSITNNLTSLFHDVRNRIKERITLSPEENSLSFLSL